MFAWEVARHANLDALNLFVHLFVLFCFVLFLFCVVLVWTCVATFEECGRWQGPLTWLPSSTWETIFLTISHLDIRQCDLLKILDRKVKVEFDLSM